jgi:hypothetical protein
VPEYNNLMSSFIDKAKMALETAGDVVQSMAEGNAPLAPEEEQKRRFDLCMGCPSKRDLLGKIQCSECGCIMNLKTKLAASKCPLNKW